MKKGGKKIWLLTYLILFSIIVVATNDLKFHDIFTSDSTPDDDGKAWINVEPLYDYMYLDSPGTNVDAICFDFENDGTFDKCRYEPGKLSQCNNYSDSFGSGDPYGFYDLCYNAPNSECAEDSGLNDTFPLSIDSIKERQVDLRFWRDCDDSNSNQATWGDTDTYYVYDQRRALCQAASNYNLEGRYGITSWENYKTSLNCDSNKQCDYFQDDENNISHKTDPLDPCRLKNGEACTLDSQCLTQSTCFNNVCGNETDLAILDVIPVQVIPDIDMVKDKSGYVRVIVHNYGPLTVKGQVNVTFDGNLLAPYEPSTGSQTIVNGQNATFDFSFKPDTAGSNKLISAVVEVVE